MYRSAVPLYLYRELPNFDLRHERLHRGKFDPAGRGRHAIRCTASRCQAKRFFAAQAPRRCVRETRQRRVPRSDRRNGFHLRRPRLPQRSTLALEPDQSFAAQSNRRTSHSAVHDFPRGVNHLVRSRQRPSHQSFRFGAIYFHKIRPRVHALHASASPLVSTNTFVPAARAASINAA